MKINFVDIHRDSLRQRQKQGKRVFEYYVFFLCSFHCVTSQRFPFLSFIMMKSHKRKILEKKVIKMQFRSFWRLNIKKARRETWNHQETQNLICLFLFITETYRRMMKENIQPQQQETGRILSKNRITGIYHATLMLKKKKREKVFL